MYKLFIIAVLVLVGALLWRFPYAMQSQEEQVHLLYLVLLLAAGGIGVWSGEGAKLSRNLRDLGIWAIIIVALVLAYSYRDLLGRSRLAAEIMPSRTQSAEDGSFSVRSSENGHFYIEGEVNGALVKFLVDTGASDIVLSPQDAQRAGFDPAALEYTGRSYTANGVVHSAPVRVKELAVGEMVLRDVRASVNGAAMEESLLGMTFLSHLSSYSVEGDRLVLKP